MDLLSYWNLREPLFEATRDTRFYFSIQPDAAKSPALNQGISLRIHLETEAIARIFIGIAGKINQLAKLALEYAWLSKMPLEAESAAEIITPDPSRHLNFCAA